MSDSDNLENIGHAMMLAWTRIKRAESRMWADWMVIGEGLMEGRRWAMRQANSNEPEGKGYVMAFAEWLKRFKVDDMDKSDRAKLLQLMEERPAIEEWRATLTDPERRRINNPTIVWRKWTAATRVKKPKARPAAPAPAVVAQLQERVEELEQELTSARETQPFTLEDLHRRLVALLRAQAVAEQIAAIGRLAADLGLPEAIADGSRIVEPEGPGNTTIRPAQTKAGKPAGYVVYAGDRKVGTEKTLAAAQELAQEHVAASQRGDRLGELTGEIHALLKQHGTAVQLRDRVDLHAALGVLFRQGRELIEAANPGKKNKKAVAKLWREFIAKCARQPGFAIAAPLPQVETWMRAANAGNETELKP